MHSKGARENKKAPGGSRRTATSGRWLLTALNAGLGYCLPLWMAMAAAFLTNRPKGTGYFVPETERPFNLTLGILLLLALAGAEALVNIPALRLWRRLAGVAASGSASGPKGPKGAKKAWLLIAAFTAFGAAAFFVVSAVTRNGQTLW